MIMATYNGVTSGIISFIIKAKDDTQSNPNTPDNSNRFDKTDTQIFLMHPTRKINTLKSQVEKPRLIAMATMSLRLRQQKARQFITLLIIASLLLVV